MPRALDTVSGFVTAPGGTLTAWTIASGDSLAVRNAPLDKKIWFIDFWAFNQVAGTLRVRSPRLHDNVQGIRMNVLAAQTDAFLPRKMVEPLFPQDTLIAEQSGSAVGGQIESGSLLIYYEELPGIASRLTTFDDVVKRARHFVTNENPITPGAAGGYSGGAALNASFDLLKANTDYAVLGGLVSARCASATLRGADTGNLRVSLPGEPTARVITHDWFTRKSRIMGLPLVPQINSANKAGITVDVVQNQAAGAVTITWILAELGAA